MVPHLLPFSAYPAHSREKVLPIASVKGGRFDEQA